MTNFWLLKGGGCFSGRGPSRKQFLDGMMLDQAIIVDHWWLKYCDITYCFAIPYAYLNLHTYDNSFNILYLIICLFIYFLLHTKNCPEYTITCTCAWTCFLNLGAAYPKLIRDFLELFPESSYLITLTRSSSVRTLRFFDAMLTRK